LGAGVLTAVRLRVAATGTVTFMADDPKLARDARGFRLSGARILLIGLAVAVVGGLLWLLGQALGDVLAGIGGMIATLGGVAAVVGLVLLGISAVTNRMAHHRPFA
jgi:hypothetical protein